MNDITELRRLKVVLKENKKIQDELAEIREYLISVVEEFGVFEDKLKGVMPRVRKLQGELTAHRNKLKVYVPEKLKKAAENL